jgi:ABC-type nitrate/sulfonate/bicarbonate transport system substrate-binding protein
MRIPLIRFAVAFVFAALFVKADAFAQLTKLNFGYVGVTSDNAAAFIAHETGIYARNGLDAKQYPTLEGLRTILASDPR